MLSLLYNLPWYSISLAEILKVGDDGVDPIVFCFLQHSFRINIWVDDEIPCAEVVKDRLKVLGASVDQEGPSAVLTAGHHLLLLAGKHSCQHAVRLLEEQCGPELDA